MATLGELKTRLDSYVFRTDVSYTSNRVEFINAGLRWLQRQLQVTPSFAGRWEHETKVQLGTEEVPASNEYRPSDRTRFEIIQEGLPVELRRIPLEWLSEPFYDQDRGETVDLRNKTLFGTPLYYAIWGRSFLIRPPADRTYPIIVHGQRFLPALVNDGDENILTCEAEDACLYAAIGEAWLLFEDAGRADFWRDRALPALREWEADQRLEDRDERPRVMRPPG